MRNLLVVVPVLGILLASCSSLSRSERSHVERWVEQLDSPSIDERDEAVRSLIAIGTPALPYLKELLRDSKSAEARAQAKEAMETIEWRDRLRPGGSAHRLTKGRIRLQFTHKLASRYQKPRWRLLGAEDDTGRSLTILQNGRRMVEIPKLGRSIESWVPPFQLTGLSPTATKIARLRAFVQIRVPTELPQQEQIDLPKAGDAIEIDGNRIQVMFLQSSSVRFQVQTVGAVSRLDRVVVHALTEKHGWVRARSFVRRDRLGCVRWDRPFELLYYAQFKGINCRSIRALKFTLPQPTRPLSISFELKNLPIQK